MQQVGHQASASMRAGVALQLFLSHLLAGGLALALCWLLLAAGISLAPAGVLAALAAAALGLLLTANLQYGLALLEVALRRFAQGLPSERVLGRRWPLTSLFAHFDGLAKQMKALSRNEALMTDFREQMLHQAREAAALEERNRIARDLHDSIKQQIFSISMSAAAARAPWQESEQDAREALDDIQRSAKEAQVEMLALLQQLRASPLEHTDLNAALRTQAEALGYRTGARVQVALAELPPVERLPANAQRPSSASCRRPSRTSRATRVPGWSISLSLRRVRRLC